MHRRRPGTVGSSSLHSASPLSAVGARGATRVPLRFNRVGEDGIFHRVYEIPEVGFYEATIHARQKSTGNTGGAMVTFFVKPPSGC